MMTRAVLIFAGIGTLAVMEIQTPPRAKSAVSEPPALSVVEVRESDRTLPKEDRLVIFSAKPDQPASSFGAISSPNVAASISKQAPHILDQPTSVVKEKKAVVLGAKPTPTSPRPKAGWKDEPPKLSTETEPCRSNAFDGLLKALDLPRRCKT